MWNVRDTNASRYRPMFSTKARSRNSVGPSASTRNISRNETRMISSLIRRMPLSRPVATVVAAGPVVAGWFIHVSVFSAQAEAIVADKVFPALDRQIALVEELRAKASDDAGVWRLPDGADYYAAAVRSSTTTTMSPEEVHQLGVEQVADITARKEAEQALSASEARRMACNAHIIPVVLGGKSEVLDLGRTRRLFSKAQRRALRLRDKRCRAEGCTIPAKWTEAHHLKPWSEGGSTNLDDAVGFCSHHHHRAHDHAYEHERLPNGDYRFHRRT